MTNYGAVAILAALPEAAPARQVRVLIALETFKADTDGWRQVGAALLAATANVSRSTLKRARPELTEAKLITYRPGGGRGCLSQYRIDLDLRRGPASGPFSSGEKGVHRHLERGPRTGQKGSTGETGKSAVAAGQAAQNGHKPGIPALGAKAPALKAGASSSVGASRVRAGGADAETPKPAHKAPPCPECGQPFSQEQLANPDFRQMALDGDAIHDECLAAADQRYLLEASARQLMADGAAEDAIKAGRQLAEFTALGYVP